VHWDKGSSQASLKVAKKAWAMRVQTATCSAAPRPAPFFSAAFRSLAIGKRRTVGFTAKTFNPESPDQSHCCSACLASAGSGLRAIWDRTGVNASGALNRRPIG
jgi:hypothetical protein